MASSIPFPRWFSGAMGLVIVMAACTPAAPVAPTPASPAVASSAPSSPASVPKEQTALEKMVERAREEGKVVYWSSSPQQDGTMQALEKAFNARFGLDIKIEHVKLDSSTSTSRTIAETSAGRVPGDIFFSSAAQLLQVVQAGTVEKTDWTGIFGGKLPGIEKRANTLIPDIRGYGVLLHDTTYCLAYNTKLVRKEEVPTRWEGLADPKWKGRSTIDARSFPFPLLVSQPGWSQEKVEQLVREVLKNDPLIVPANRGDEVARGEVSLQIVWVRIARQLKAQGAPVDCVFMEPTPVIPVYLGVTKTAAHPNASRLFLAWLVTEGLPILDEREFLGGQVTDPATAVGRSVKEAGTQIAIEKSSEDVKTTGTMARRITEIITQVRKN